MTELEQKQRQNNFLKRTLKIKMMRLLNGDKHNEALELFWNNEVLMNDINIEYYSTIINGHLVRSLVADGNAFIISKLKLKELETA